MDLWLLGLETKEFSFYAFLPLNHKLRREKFDEMKNDQKTIVFYEAPHRIKDTLNELLDYFGDRKVVIAKELTKIHETFYRGTLNEVTKIFSDIKDVKGEYVIILQGIKNEKNNNLENLSIDDQYKIYEMQGMTKKEIIKRIAKERNLPKNDVYQQFLNK